MIAWCSHCASFSNVENTQCAACGNSMGDVRGGALFLSGAGVQESLPLDIPKGEVFLERFEIAERLGAGKSGTVYRAVDLLAQDEVAIKFSRLSGSARRAVSSDALREWKAHTAIQDFTHIIRALGFHAAAWGGEWLLLLVMEYADGGDLRARLGRRRNELPSRIREGVEWAKQICTGAGVMNDAGLVVSDLKPENILFSRGAVKIADVVPAGSMGSDLLTRLGLNGFEWRHSSTPEYMAPELFHAASGAVLDARSNVYSIGVILFEIFHPAGARPFEGTFDELCERHAQWPAPPLEIDQPELSQIVFKCLAKRPEERFLSAWDVRAGLEGLNAPPGPRNAPEQGARNTCQEHSEISSLFDQACAEMSQGRFPEAHRSCAAILARQPEHVQAREMAEAIRVRREQAAQICEELRHSQNTMGLREIAALLQEAAGIYPDPPGFRQAQALFAARVQEYESCAGEAFAAFANASWERAIPFLRKAAAMNPGHPQLEICLTFASGVIEKRERLHTGIQEAMTAGKRREASALASELKRYLIEVQRRGASLLET